MASVKIFSLVVRTLAKPIANTIKGQATEHESFRNVCIGIAQRMHRYEARLRLGLLNEEAKNVKPLNDAKAVQNGATFLAESFLFAVAAGLVLGETYRSSRKERNRRDDVRERLEGLEEEMKRVREGLDGVGDKWDRGIEEVREQNANLEKVLSTVVTNGLKAGWLALGHESPGTSASSVSSESVLPLIDPSRDAAVSNTPIASASGSGANGTVREAAHPTRGSAVLDELAMKRKQRLQEAESRIDIGQSDADMV